MTPDEWQTLKPYDAREVLTPQQAAASAKRSVSTIRTWAADFGLGRKVGGRMQVSCVALAMYLDGNTAALAAYLAGQRHTAIVADYYSRMELADVLRSLAFASLKQKAQKAQSAQNVPMRIARAVG